MNRPRTLVIIPAAGSGSRFGGEVPKQYRLLAGRPILDHVIRRFLSDEEVDRIVVCVADDRLADMQRTDGYERVEVVAGGPTRQQSVARGLLAARDDDFELVAIHDAVRPFFRLSTLHALLRAALLYGAALPAVPVSDTIHGIRDGVIATTFDRRDLVAAQTPQCFRVQLLREVLDRAEQAGDDATDEAGLAARYGFAVKVVAGDPMNFKITRTEDLEIAETVLKNWREEE